MFCRMILVATGSSIGPCSNAIFGGRIPVRLLSTFTQRQGDFR